MLKLLIFASFLQAAPQAPRKQAPQPPPPPKLEPFGRPNNSRVLMEQIVELYDEILAYLVDPETNEKRPNDAEFTRFKAAGTCGLLGALNVHYGTLKERITSQADPAVPAQSEMVGDADKQHQRLRVVAEGFCGIQSRPDFPLGSPSDGFLEDMRYLRRRMLGAVYKPLSNPDYSRSNPKLLAQQGQQYLKLMKLFTIDREGKRRPELETPDTYLRMCYFVGQGATWVGRADDARRVLRKDEDRSQLDNCDRLASQASADIGEVFNEFCMSEKRGMGISPGELTEPLFRAIDDVAAKVNELTETCK